MERLKERLKQAKKNQKGFTLVELIIVIVIIAVLAAIAIPAVSQYIERANKSKVLSNARNAYSAACVVASDVYTGTFTSDDDDEIEEEIKKLAQVKGDITVDFTDNGAVDPGTFEYEENGYVVKFAGGDLAVTDAT